MADFQMHSIPTQLLNQRPISFEDNIASLGNLIDAIAQRRQAQANADREFAFKQQQQELSRQREAGIDARDLRRQRVDWSQQNNKVIQGAQKEAETGLPRSFVYIDDQGNPSTVTPSYEPQAPEPVAPVADDGPQDIDTMLSEYGQAPQASVTHQAPGQVAGVMYSQLPDLASIENLNEADLDARTAALQPQQDRRVRIPLPGQDPISVDQGEARRAAQERQGQIRAAIATASSPGEKQALESMLAAETAQFGEKMGKEFVAQANKNDRALNGIEARKSLAETNIEGRENLERLRQEGRMALQAEKTKKRSSGGGLGMPTVSTGGGEFIPIPVTRYGKRPDMLISRVDTEWRAYSMDEKLPVQLMGLRRLKLAEHNLAANGPSSGVLNIEAAFNYLGFIRGGVPVKNETDEMLTERRTWADKIHGFLAKAGLGEIAAKFSEGREITKDEVAAAVNVMSPAEKARIAEGIRESLAVMNGQVNDTLKPFVSQYASYGGPGGQLMRQHSVGLVNARLASAGMPANFNPFRDVTTPGTSKVLKEGAEGQVGGAGGKMSDEQLLEALKGMK